MNRYFPFLALEAPHVSAPTFSHFLIAVTLPAMAPGEARSQFGRYQKAQRMAELPREEALCAISINICSLMRKKGDYVLATDVPIMFCPRIPRSQASGPFPKIFGQIPGPRNAACGTSPRDSDSCPSPGTLYIALPGTEAG